MGLLSTVARVGAVAVCLAGAMLLPGHALAKEYGHYDIKLVLVPAASPGTGARLDVGYLDRMMRDIGQHASKYPPHFDSAQDQQRAQRDVGSLMGMLDAGFGTAAPPELLLRMGILGSFGHNLQIPNGAVYAQARFTKLLEAHPADPMANYHYRQLLSGTGRVNEALPYLTKAKDKGVVPALYALGMVHLAQGDKAKAIEMLSAYQQAQPADQSVGKLIQGIRDGKVEVKQVGGK